MTEENVHHIKDRLSQTLDHMQVENMQKQEPIYSASEIAEALHQASQEIPNSPYLGDEVGPIRQIAVYDHFIVLTNGVEIRMLPNNLQHSYNVRLADRWDAAIKPEIAGDMWLTYKRDFT